MSRYNIEHYLEKQRLERFPSFIIYAPPVAGKTEWARAAAQAVDDAHYLDLQQYFVDHPTLAARIDRLRPDDLKQLLLNLETAAPIIFVDNLDFLLNLWSSSAARRREFLHLVKLGLKSPDVTDKLFAFVVQDHPWITRASFSHSTQPRILPLNHFQAV